MKKVAIVLFNLGGPEEPDSIKPFLFNLFHDPAIIRLSQPLRFLIAKRIASNREPVARAIYAKIGGGSPILENTQAQARALEAVLNSPRKQDMEIRNKFALSKFVPKDENGEGSAVFRCFIAMRYWHPFAEATAAQVKTFGPDEIVLLPLYPQFSTTTTASSLKAWRRAAQKSELNALTKTICCYPGDNGFIGALAASTRKAYAEQRLHGAPRVLFSAHGLPEKIVTVGDPYQWQCEQTAKALVETMGIENLDWVLCYQSRVGPLKWIGPSTDEEIRRAGRDRLPLVVVPMAFVSEHSETLVEIDIEYRHMAKETGVPAFACVPAVGVAPDFIEGLAGLVYRALGQTKDCASATGGRICPGEFSGCACVS